MDNYESYRSRIVSKLAEILPAEQLHQTIEALDVVAGDYDITHKPVEIIPVEEIPAVLKLFIASKALENTSETTLKNYKTSLMNFFKAVQKPITDIATNDIRAYLYAYKNTRNVSDYSLDTLRRVINSFFSWCVTNEYLIRNPAARIPKIKYQEPEKAVLTPYDLELMRWRCNDVREKAIIDTLFSSGIRVSECAALNRDDIDWSTRSVTVRHGKGDKRRVVYINAEAAVSLQAYLASRKDDDPALFVSSRAPFGRLSTRGIEREIKRIKSRVDADAECTPHTLRRTFATCAIRSGMPLEQLQELMGHSKPETTLIYTKLDQSDLRKAHARAFG